MYSTSQAFTVVFFNVKYCSIEESWEEKKKPKNLDGFFVLFWNCTSFVLSDFFDPAKYKPKFTLFLPPLQTANVAAA